MSINIDRREFMKGAAGMAGILAAGQAPSLYAAGANNKVRVACVGYSDRFRQTLLPCFMAAKEESRFANFDIVAVADLWKKRLYGPAKSGIESVVGHSVETFESDLALYEAKDKLDLDAVIISTADFQHAQHAVRAVNAGLDSYCEKPLAEDMYSANMLLDAVNAKRASGAMKPGSVLQVGSQRRSGPTYKAARDYIRSGVFGDISYVHLTWNVNQPRRWRRDEKLVKSLKKEDIDWNQWLLDRDPAVNEFSARKYLEFRLFWPFSSGIPGQWMCHQIDTVAWFMGYPWPKSAVASGGLYQWADGRQSYDTFTTVMEYGESGVKGKGFQVMFQSHQTNCAGGSWAYGESPVEKYYGPNGCIDLGSGCVTNEGVEIMKTKPQSKPKKEKLPAPHEKVVTSANTGGDNLTKAHMLNWMESVLVRKDPNAPVEAGYSHAVALVMSNAALRTGLKATFDEKSRQVLAGDKPWTGYKQV